MSAPAPPRRARRERRVSGSITLADVAKIAGVAISTASRALNSPERVSPQALRSVKEAVDRTGYVPNLLAGGLASNRSRVVATLIPTFTSSVFSRSVQAIADTLGSSGYHVMLGQSGYGANQEEALLGAILSRRPDGMILTGIVHSPEARRRLVAAGIPIVETWDLTPTPIDMLVGFSHERIGAAVAAFLIGRGVRRPGVISANDPRALLRKQGFVDEARRRGIAEVSVHLTDAPTTLGFGRLGLKDLLARDPGIDGVCCSSDMLAGGVIIEARCRAIPVPDRLKVVGFGDLDFAGDLDPSLSTVRVDGEAIGQQAARFIIDALAGKPPPNRVIDVGFSVVPRGSA